MIYNFDYNNRFEKPTLILCDPDDTEIGVINNPIDYNSNLCFSDISDISYRIDWIDDSEDPNANEIYDMHIERRQVHAIGVGFFIITDVNEIEDSNGRYKSIQAKSCEYELNNINMPYVNGTYELYKAENFPDQKTPAEIVGQGDDYMNDNCLMYEIMKVIPSWTLENQMELVGDTTADGSRDYSDLAKTCRTFESTDVTVYSFLRNELSDSYNCFVEFDIERRTIRLVKHEDVFKELPVIISNENFLNSCEVRTTIDNYVNSLKVEGAGAVNIASCNPIGGTTIYNFEHDINIGLISGELKEALEYWRDKMTKIGRYNGVDFNTIQYVDASGNSCISSGRDSLQSWLDSFSKLSTYKNTLLEAIGTNKQYEIDKIITDKNFLSGLGMDYKTKPYNSSTIYDPTTKKQSYVEQITDIAKIISGQKIDTAAISNIFYEMQFERANLLFVDINKGTSGVRTRYPLMAVVNRENAELSEESKSLISAQEFQTRVESEIKNMTSTYNGFEAEYKALQTTKTEGGYLIYQDGDEWTYSATTTIKSDLVEVENIVAQLNLVKQYMDMAQSEKEKYEELLGATDDSNESLTIYGLVNSLSGFKNNLQDSNTFKSRFEDYYSEKHGQSSEEAQISADKLYTKLTRYLKQQTYTDENIVITDSMTLEEKFKQEQELYDQSVLLLDKISEPAYEISVGAETFMFLPETLKSIREIDGYENSTETINVLSGLHVRLPSGDIPLFHILKITTSFDEMTCDFTLGNRIRLSDPAAVFSDLQKTVTSAANIVATERLNWGINEEKINELMLAKSADINTTSQAMTNSINDVTFGDFGLKCYAKDSAGNPSYGMWCANGVMMFMNETDTPKMAIGRIIKADGTVDYGFYGQSIIANSVSADKLVAGAVSKGTNYVKNGSFEKTIDEYTLVNTKPSNWNTAYTNYYKVSGGEYVQNPNGTIPTWKSNTFYSKRSIPDSSHWLQTGAFESVADNKILGEKCGFLDIENTSTASTTRAVKQNISTMLPAGRYMFSCYYKYKLVGDVEIDDNNDIFWVEYGIKNETSGFYTNKTKIVSAKTTDEDVLDGWKRCSATIVLSDPSAIQITLYAKATNGVTYISGSKYIDGVYIDGVMLERSEQLNDYSPHISETYAKYTTIDDTGVTVYDGKISILNKAGSPVFRADTNGNLSIIGKLTASTGSNIAGWTTDDKKIHKGGTGMASEGSYAFYAGATTFDTNGPTKLKFGVTHDGELTSTSGKIGGWTIEDTVLKNGYTGMSTNGTYVFYAGQSDNYDFSVTQKGLLFARDAKIDKKLTLENEKYKMEFDGYSILMKYDNSSAFSSAISFTSTDEGLFGSKTNNANLAIAGSTKILFGTRPGGSWKALCEIEHTLESDIFNAFYLKPCSGVLDRAMLGSIDRPWTDVWVKGTLGVPIQVSALLQAICMTLGTNILTSAGFIAYLATYGITGLIF